MPSTMFELSSFLGGIAFTVCVQMVYRMSKQLHKLEKMTNEEYREYLGRRHQSGKD